MAQVGPLYSVAKALPDKAFVLFKTMITQIFTHTFFVLCRKKVGW